MCYSRLPVPKYTDIMALCEGQLDSVLPQLKREESSPSSEGPESPQKKPKLEPNGDIYGLNKVAGGLPLSVDYRSPVSHFVPPAVELYAARHKTRDISNGPKAETSSSTPAKRKRGRPRIDKTSPEYLANVAARKQAKEMEALEKKAKREYRRRTGGKPMLKISSGSRVVKTIQARSKHMRKLPPHAGVRQIDDNKVLVRQNDQKVVVRRKTMFIKRKDSAASSSTGDSTPRVKRKYTKRTPSTKKNDSQSSGERVKGKRGRPRKIDQLAKEQQPKIRVRSNLMPNSEPIPVDSDDEPGLAAVINNRSDTGEKRKRGRPRVDKTSPEYLARKRIRELEALEKKAKREYRRRTGGKPMLKISCGSRVVKTIQAKSKHMRKLPPHAGVRQIDDNKVLVRQNDQKVVVRRKTMFIMRKDSAASSSTGDSTPRVKRKYTKRTPSTKKNDSVSRCDMCGAQFPRYEQLSRHRQCAHGALPPHMPHACAQCGKRFSHAHSLTRHMHNHAKQLYRCVVCKASFARADQLAQHLNSHLANYKRMKP
ncbi:Zinc finger protein 181 [Papilio machaon]|uniref:Zinc finger protein 181 n=1 Tax=Papilio machaon TaxID=76193 RepID=A0A0N1IJM9_PAPMA|nr:Zinc finger protein 181 [Papilio machaon]